MRVLDHLTWTVREGEKWVVVGGNGHLDARLRLLEAWSVRFDQLAVPFRCLSLFAVWPTKEVARPPYSISSRARTSSAARQLWDARCCGSR